MPEITLNPLAMGIAVFAGFMFCYLWYSVLFKKAWMAEMNITQEKQGAALFKAMGLTLLGIALLTFVLANDIAAWTPATWGSDLPGNPPMMQAFQAALFTWLGFFLPQLLDAVAWRNDSWKMLAIHGGYYFFLLLIVSSILVFVS